MPITPPIIVENFNLSELKTFLTEQDLNTTYTCDPREQDFMLYTTPEGMDIQNSYQLYPVEAKFWVQYFPLADAFSLNINFFSTLDGAPVGVQDFITKLPTAIKQYEYYNSPKIRWSKENDIYVKDVPEGCPYTVYPGFTSISPK